VTGILDRLDAALQKARFRRLELRGIYLDEADYAAFAKAMTRRWRKASGSRAGVFPLAYDSVLIIGGSAMVHEAKKSAVYATSGEAVVIPKRLSPRVGKPPERKCA
jgi:excinuclease UvrABC nuclease subunit